MISLKEAQARLFALGEAVACEVVSLGDAAGRWAAADVIALRNQPARDLSAMDGYAIRHCDLPGPWRIVGESAAGNHYSGNVAPETAVRIFTGAVVPDGADCILIQENARRSGEQLTLHSDAPDIGQHIRQAGGDFCKGATVVATGELLSPPRLALAAMAGYDELTVHRKVSVAIISTGDELLPPGKLCADDQIPSSNAPMLAALLTDLPIEIDDRGIIKDDLEALSAEFAACANHDIIVTIGGASVGDHDLVHPALLNAGATLDFWKIAMRPGKPVMAGKIKDAILLGLPGNPVSAYVVATVLLKPLVAALSGAKHPLPMRIVTRLKGELRANGERLDHIRASWDGENAIPLDSRDSSKLTELSQANLLIIRKPLAPREADGAIIHGIMIA